jgi:hypothetical protein
MKETLVRKEKKMTNWWPFFFTFGRTSEVLPMDLNRTPSAALANSTKYSNWHAGVNAFSSWQYRLLRCRIPLDSWTHWAVSPSTAVDVAVRQENGATSKTTLLPKMKCWLSRCFVKNIWVTYPPHLEINLCLSKGSLIQKKNFSKNILFCFNW